MAVEQVHKNADDRTEGRQALKRRGLIAGAAALVAGMVAKQTSQPAEANDGVWQWPYVGVVSTASGGSAMDIQNNGPNSDGLTIRTTRGGIVAQGDSFGVQGSGGTTGTGVVGGGGAFSGAGVKGISAGATRDEFGSGVYGKSANGYGVYGEAADGGYGVTGVATTALGVLGQSTSGTGVLGTSSVTGVQGLGGGDTSGNATGFPIGVRGSIPDTGYAVYGNAGRGYGVYGNAPGGVGVGGVGGTGVLGTSGANSTSKGVYGHHTSNGYGVYGDAGDGGYGVTGVATTAIGVLGQSTIGSGVQGQSGSGFPIIGLVTGGTNGNAGVLGVGTAGPGVQGQSNGHGLVGTTFATDGQHAALIGSVQPGGNAIALRGSIPPGATGLAGMFDGNVRITGTFVAPTMQAVVTHAGDSTLRLLHTITAPEGWVEDFGTGTLAGDKAQVALDPDFAALVHADQYHVFLTPEGPLHLHVAQKSVTGFAVLAMAWATQAGGPKGAEGGGTFSWRVVAKRKDIAGERLAKVPPPTPLKAVTPFTEPETPKPPAKKP